MQIFVGFHGEGPQTTVGWSEPVMSGNFSCHIFRAVRVKANIIRSVMKCHVVLLVTLKCLTLDDLQVPFYAKICFHHWFD